MKPRLTEVDDEEGGEESFLRSLILPEEDRHHYTALPWTGGYRWFRTENVVCIEHYRHPSRIFVVKGPRKHV
jgi:hypothetical protein